MITSSLAAIIVCFNKPLGPCYASDLFEPGSVWDVEDLQMYSGPNPTGLDETEFLVSAQDDTDSNPVLCRGVVTLNAHDVSRLSAVGTERLQVAAKSRLSEKLSEWGSASSSKYRNPTSLKEVLAKEEVQVRIEVVFKKDLAAAYSTRRSNDKVMKGEAGIRMHSAKIHPGEKPIRHTFRVKSLHILCYELSRKWLARYQLRDLLEVLKDHVVDRNPEGFIDVYCTLHADGTLEDANRFGSEEEDAPRRPRKVHKAEIRHHLVAHALWLLAEQISILKYSQRTIDVVAFYDWFLEMMEERRKAWDERPQDKWGWEPGLSAKEINQRVQEECSEDYELDITEFGVADALRGSNFAKRIESTREKQLASARKQAKADSLRPTLPIAISSRPQQTGSSSSPSLKRVKKEHVDQPSSTDEPSADERKHKHHVSVPAVPVPAPPPKVIFADNFSDDYSSSADEDNSEDEAIALAMQPLDPEVRSRLHPLLESDPRLPERGLIWKCPLPPYEQAGRTCPFTINFATISFEEMVEVGIERTLAGYISNRIFEGGIGTDENVAKVFRMLTHRHWCEHLIAKGLRKGDNGIGYFLIAPRPPAPAVPCVTRLIH